jgi:hypothetical protein
LEGCQKPHEQHDTDAGHRHEVGTLSGFTDKGHDLVRVHTRQEMMGDT